MEVNFFSKCMKTQILWCQTVVALSCPTVMYVSSIANQTFLKLWLCLKWHVQFP
jgi:hypothetical protein